jgi:hypothetical protein
VRADWAGRATCAETPYAFDLALGEGDTTQQLFDGCVEGVVEDILGGKSATIFACVAASGRVSWTNHTSPSAADGATGSGKTFTMSGTDKDPGIMPLTIRCVRGVLRKASCPPHKAVRAGSSSGTWTARRASRWCAATSRSVSRATLALPVRVACRSHARGSACRQ